MIFTKKIVKKSVGNNMTYLVNFIHGDNQVLSRNKLLELIKQANLSKKEIVSLDGLKITLNQLIVALESSSLFDQEKLIIIENLFSRPSSKEKDLIVKYLKKEKIDPKMIIWEKKEISGTTTRWLPKDWHFFLFKTQANIFKFLDSVKINNNKMILFWLHEALKKDEPQMIFYFLCRRVRELIIALDLGSKGLKGAPWQIGKLINQAKCFNLDQLKGLYSKLLKIDIDIKTGRSLMSLPCALDFLMVNL